MLGSRQGSPLTNTAPLCRFHLDQLRDERRVEHTYSISMTTGNWSESKVYLLSAGHPLKHQPEDSPILSIEPLRPGYPATEVHTRLGGEQRGSWAAVEAKVQPLLFGGEVQAQHLAFSVSI